jgi:hypothetical protein
VGDLPFSAKAFLVTPQPVRLFFFIVVVVLSGGILGYLQKFFQCIKYIIFEFTSSAALIPPTPQVPEQSQQVSVLHLLTYVYIIWVKKLKIILSQRNHVHNYCIQYS